MSIAKQAEVANVQTQLPGDGYYTGAGAVALISYEGGVSTSLVVTQNPALAPGSDVRTGIA